MVFYKALHKVVYGVLHKVLYNKYTRYFVAII